VKRFVSVLRDRARTKLSAANLLLGHFGIQIVRKPNSFGFRPALRRIKALGIEPATIFDIGVAYGTEDLYAEFKCAKYFLVDPVPQSLPYMQRWAKTLHATVHNVALGESDGELEIGVPDDIRESTLYEEIEQSGSLKRISVPIKRFDSIFQPADLVSPSLVKIDVQGAELALLKGMGQLIHDIDIFIIEVSSIVTLDGPAAHMFDVLDYLRRNEFTVYDVCGLCRRPLDNALAQMDLMFCKNTSKLLQDRRWSAQ
jgi:FkbM family methyltransferase